MVKKFEALEKEVQNGKGTLVSEIEQLKSKISEL